MSNKTNSGFEFKIKESSLDDWELLELIEELDENPQKMVRIAMKLLGKEQYKLLKKHCTSTDGVVSLIKMTNEITEIMNNSNQVKN